MYSPVRRHISQMFFMCRPTAEYISLELFYFVSLTSSCSFISVLCRAGWSLWCGRTPFINCDISVRCSAGWSVWCGRTPFCNCDIFVHCRAGWSLWCGRTPFINCDGHLSLTVTSLYTAVRDEGCGVDGHISITVTPLYIAGRDEGRGVDWHLSGRHHYHGPLGSSHPGFCRHRWLCAGVGSCGRTRKDQIRWVGWTWPWVLAWFGPKLVSGSGSAV